MSTAPPSSHKSWWSRSKPSKDQTPLHINRSATSLNEKQSMKSTASNGTSKSKDNSSSRFNSLVAAMGKKNKRPTLTIQDPPPPIPIVSPLSITVPSHPPRKSPSPSIYSPKSSSRPQVEINTAFQRRYHDMDQASDPHTVSEPRTPSDHPRDRLSYQTSVMTLSDPDPFASVGANGAFSPRVVDPNRLSVYSDSSLLDPSSKRPDVVSSNRISYGSSSSNSHGQPFEGHAVRSHLQPPVPPGSLGQLPRRPSDSNFGTRRQGNHISGDFDDASFVLPSNHFKSHNRGVVQASRDSNSSHSTLTQLEGQQAKSLYRNGHSQTPRSNPPPVRARGMTVGAIATRRPSTAAGALEQAPSGSATSLLGSIQTRGINTARPPGSFIPPSYSPITFHRNRSLSNATDSNSPDSFHGTRPLVLVRKASSPRVAMPPPLATPPSSGLPPLPSSPGSQSFIESVEDLSSLVFPDNPSSSSSSLSFASDTAFDMVGADGDEIYNLMRDSFVDNDFRLDTFPPRSPPATIRNVNVGTSSPVKRSSSSRMHPGDTAHPRLLKKAISQQSLLGKRFSGASVASSIASGSVATDDTSMRGSIINSLGMKIPRKQRSFHHPLIPLPPLPSLRHANSACTPPNSSTDTSVSSPAQSPTVPEHRKPVASPQHTRKRLFSGSSTRRSSSSQPPASPTSVDEDIRSIVSHEGETRSLERRKPLMMSFSNIGNQISLVTDNACIAASWDDVTPPPLPPKDSPRKRESQSESLPQRIMSPAAMLKLEEQLAAEAAERERDEQLKNHENEQKPTPKLQLDAIDLGLSFANRRPKSNRSRAGSTISDMSVATFGKSERISPISTINHHSLMHHEGTTSRRSSVKTPSVQTVEELHFPVRSSSVMVGRTTKPPLLSIRPSTTQAAITPPMSPVSIAPSPGRSTSSLPPPHRPRPPRERETFERDDEIGFKRASILPIHPLSPPPRRKSAKPTVAFEPQDRHVQQRPPPSAFDPQKFTNRRSIVKRPSFLDIDDEEVDQEVETSLSPMESSFLDLDRGKDSFDTLRSFDDELRVY